MCIRDRQSTWGGCYLLIGITASQDQGAKLTFFTKVKDFTVHLQNAKPFTDFIDDTKVPNRYSYEITAPTSLILDVLVHYGNPIIKVAQDEYYDPTNPETVAYRLTTNDKLGTHHTHLNLVIPVEEIKTALHCDNNGNCLPSVRLLFIVNSDDKASYEISLRTPDGRTLLRDGITQFATLYGWDRHTFVFYSLNEVFEDSYFNIVLRRSLNTPTTILPMMGVQFEEYSEAHNFSSTPAKELRAPLREKTLTEGLDGVIVDHIKLEKGRYLIEVENLFDEAIEYSITVSAREVLTLPVNASHFSVLRQSQVHFYEFVPNREGEFMIKNRNCLGHVDIAAGSNYENVVRRNYDIALKKENDGMDEITILDVKTPGQPIYFGVEFRDGVPVYNLSLIHI
eukprot:TRINITY_DN4498_c0_g1_i19.p2 TRINITY_DN4498_c0_g1~~TRINITY_DN4498_c0_g1_i19.p2  ORF type:complete len:416 (-),score=139.94 TRINITY_DN4498_c0_g1_i19:43-1230(-)